MERRKEHQDTLCTCDNTEESIHYAFAQSAQGGNELAQTGIKICNCVPGIVMSKKTAMESTKAKVFTDIASQSNIINHVNSLNSEIKLN